MESQKKPTKNYGICKMIADKTGSHPWYVSRVLNGTVNTSKGKKARKILEVADQINAVLN